MSELPTAGMRAKSAFWPITTAIAIVTVIGSGALSVRPTVLVTGAVTGLAYATLAAGIVLVYRTSRVINLAHAEIGALAAVVLAKLVIDFGWNWIAACALVCFGGACAGAGIELAVVRRLAARPCVVLLVATIGVSGLLFAGRLAVAFDRPATTFPLPFDRRLDVGDVTVHANGLLVLAILPAVIVAVTVVLTLTPYGVVVRSVADNPDAARLAGIPVRWMSTTAWAMAGSLSAIGFVASAGLLNFSPAVPQPVGGPDMLLRALAAALVGGMRSVPLAVVGGVAIGVTDAALVSHFDPGIASLALVVFVIVAVVVPRLRDRDEAPLVQTRRSHAVSLQVLARGRVVRIDRLAVTSVVVAGILAPIVMTAGSDQQTFSRVLLFAMIAISVTMLVGWAGQPSLGQYGFVACGAAATGALVERGLSFGAAAVGAVAVGTILALAVGLLLVRAVGLSFAVATLGFAVAVHAFAVPRILGSRGDRTAVVPRPSLGPLDFADQRTYYYLCLGCLIITLVLARRVQRSGIGRSITAVRDNVTVAQAYTVSPTRARLIAFTLSGAIASLAGVLLAGLDVQIQSSAFTPDESLRAVAMAVIGGLGSLAGAVLGAVWVVGLPALTGGSPTARILTTAPLLLVLLLYLPGGLIDVVDRGRAAFVGWARAWGRATAPPPWTPSVVALRIGRRAGRSSAPKSSASVGVLTDVQGRPGFPLPVAEPCRDFQRRRDRARGIHAVPLVMSDVSVNFGGFAAVNGASIEVRAAEIVALVGANGSGKSTLLDAISGFVPATGSITVFGEPLHGRSPTQRARAGIGRAFQSSPMFGNLTVHDNVMVALESGARTQLVPSVVGLPSARRGERDKRRVASSYVDLLGLGHVAGSYVAELSTGTRRIAELACLLALDHRLLLLDEPTAGIAHAEVGAFAQLLRRIQSDLGASVLVVEHDMSLVRAVSDRVYFMDAGQVLADGPPHQIVGHPSR